MTRPTDQATRAPTTGLCYSCRHLSPAMPHCYGTGDLEPSAQWPGFVCSCSCRTADTINLPALPALSPAQKEET